jgi:tetratricopeptide (TPR) repeat protein
MVVDSGCMKCMDCVSVCPNDALYYGAGPIPWAAARRATSKARRPAHSWVEEGFLAVAFAAAFFTFRGLYGTLPFLFSLGLAGVLAYLALLGLKMVLRRQVALKGWRLKEHGSIRRAGWAFAAALALLIVLWAQSAWIRLHQLRGERAYADTLALRVSALDPSASGEPVQASAAVDRAVRSLETVRDDGLLPTPGLASRLAPLYLVQGRFSAAREAAREAVERGEEPAVARRVLARLALAAGDPAAAIREYEALLREAPAAPRSWVDLGIVQARAGRLPSAEATFAEGLARHPDSADLAYNLGLARALAGEAEEAVESFTRALELEPSHLAARENLAGVLASVGRFAEAAGHYRLALARAPDDAETRLLLARVLAALGEGTAALAEVERSLRLAPELEEAILLRQQLLEIESRSSSSTSFP